MTDDEIVEVLVGARVVPTSYRKEESEEDGEKRLRGFVRTTQVGKTEREYDWPAGARRRSRGLRPRVAPSWRPLAVPPLCLRCMEPLPDPDLDLVAGWCADCVRERSGRRAGEE
jgi:hypothetical protein